MASQFNEFFTNIATKTVSTLNPTDKNPTDLIAQNLNKFKFSDKILSKKEILEATNLLANKKSRSYQCFYPFYQTNGPFIYKPTFSHFQPFL